MTSFMDITLRLKNSRIVKTIAFFFVTFLITTTTSFCQVEICNNGLDDDFDGFIDCYDGSCANSPVCDGIFLGNDANCSVPPPQFPKFTMTLDFASPNETTNHLARMAIGDLDRDGMPEFVTMNRYTKKLFILNGNDGSIKSQTTVTWEPQWEIAIANLNNDSCGEIFFIGQDNSPPGSSNDGIYLFAYDCNLNFLWKTANKLPSDPINFGLADFDSDGLVELYAKDEIYDAHTGIRIVKSTVPNYTRINGGPVAVDILGDSNLELVVGLNIYQVNLGSRAADVGSLNILKTRNEYFIRNEFNATSIADFNLDGFLDVIASGSETAYNKTTTIYYWDVKNDVVKTYRDLTSSYGPNGWSNGTGRVNIADLDGDGKLNVSYVSGKYLYALKEDLTLLWRIVINEETSGYTGCTLFDFNGDGKSEIVYRDEQFLYIIDGTDGSVYNQKACISRTNREYPIVADVDADGSTELCVACGFDDVLAKTNFNNLNFSQYAHIRVFKSAAEPWVPARRVWNQHGYFVVNVNDDLTIPKVLQKHQLVFSTGNCTQGPNRPLNKFLNQSPFLNSEGCPTYASPDLAFSIAPSVVPPTCPDLNFTVSFQITNLGDVGLSGNIPVTFYTKNPRVTGSTKLNTIIVPLTNFKPNDLFDVVNATVNGIGSDSLYVVLNDGGTSLPTPISLPNTAFFECNYDNILGVKVKPKPVTINALEVNPNGKCTSPDNGAARAFIPISGGGENTADYNFYWSIGAVAKPVSSSDFIGPIYSGIAEGTYTVYAIHKTANCNSDTVQVVVTAIQTIIPKVIVNVLSHQTQCNPPNGKLEALVEGGNSGYTFEWIDVAKPLGITTSVAAGLIGGNYTVFVSRNGCPPIAVSAVVNDNAPDPEVVATSTPVVNCQNPDTGTVTAAVSIGGSPQPVADFTLDWYFYDNSTSTRGSQLPLANGTGASRTGLVAGYYQVLATGNSTQCPSKAFVVEVKNQIVIPVVTIIELSPQTSCDPVNPNGTLQATVTIAGVPQNPSDFTFEWFVGQNTLPINSHSNVSGINGSIAEKVKGGGQAYTVKATSSSQCSSTDDAVVTESLNNPVVTLSATPNGICDPSLVSGPATFQGSVNANVTFAGNPVVDFTNYVFEWYNGSQAIGAKRPESSSLLSSLNAGFYTLQVKRTDISCVSTPKSAEVINSTVLPVISTTVIGSTNCVAPLANGQALVTDVDGVGTSIPYVFKWHAGVDTSSPIVGATAATLANRQGGVGAFFTVLVTNQSNGCQNTATVGVPDIQSKPILTLASTDNENCSAPFSGTASVNTITYKGSPEGLSGYTFSWTHGPTTSTIAGLNLGTYELKVTRIDVGCTSDPVQVDVDNNIYTPLINIAVTNQTSCDILNPNGILSASMNETIIGGAAAETAGYTYRWSNDGNPLTLGGPSIGNTSIVNTLSGNLFYTLTVERTTTRCANTQSVFLPERILLPRLEIVATDIVDCNTHGFVTARIFIDKNNDGDSNDAGDELTPAEIAADYSIAWFRGSNVLGASLSETDRVLNELSPGVPLPAGNYTAIAKNNKTSCETSDFTDVINGPGPLFNVAVTINNKPASCKDSDGVMTAFVDSGGGVPAPFGNFTFQWFQGNPTNGLDVPSPTFYTDPVIQFIQPALDVDPSSDFGNPHPGFPAPQAPTSVNTGPSLFGRTSGTYSVVVTNNTSGCKEFKTVFLPFLQEPVIILARLKPDECVGDVGEIEVELNAPNPANQYQLQIYASANPTLGGATAKPDVNPAAALGNKFTGLAAGIYTIVARENPLLIPTGCYSSPVLVKLIEALPPKVDILGSAANSTCVASPFVGDGSLQIKVSTDTNDPFSASYLLPPPPTILQQGAPPFVTYSIGVKDASNVAVPGYPTASTFVDGNTENINGLRGETYTITVTSSKGCTTTKIFDIPDAPRVADLSGDVDVLPALACDPNLETNASIEVKNLAIPGVTASDILSDYEFRWFTDAILSTSILTADGDNTVAKGGEVLSNVGAPIPTTPVTSGSYWVRATKVATGATGGLGCLTAPFKVDIEDQSVKPTAVLTSTSDTSCETVSLFEGSISVQVTDAGSMPTPNYQYTWTSTGVSVIANNPADNGNLLTLPGLSNGTYSLSFKNNTSGCVGIAQTTIIKSATPIVILKAKATDQLICNPDGSITVGANDILVNNSVDNDHTHFDFTWSRSNVASIVVGPTQSEDVLDISNLPSIGADSYFVSVKKRAGLSPGSGCESIPLKKEILDKSKDPDISFTSIVPNSSCTPSSPNGFLQATAAERTGPAGVYNFVWTFNGGAVPPVTTLGGISPVSELTNAGPGTYLVEVTNTNTGCKFNQGYLLETNQTLSLPNIIDIDQINPTNCLPQGSVKVVSVTIGGTTVFTNPPDDLDTEYDYEWFKNTIPSGLIAGQQNSLLTNQLPGKYFVRVRNVITDCISSAVEAVIDSAAIVYPVVNIQQTAPQVLCSINLGSGALKGLADGQNDTNANYEFKWFPNLNTSGASFASSSTINNLVAGEYSLEVHNLSTNCRASALFFLPEDRIEFKPVLALSSNPLTECDTNDGSVFARGVLFPINTDPAMNYPFTYNYTADMYVGNPPADLNNPEFPNMPPDPSNPSFTENHLQDKLTTGIYTVRLTDNNTGCFTIDKVLVDDLRKFPKPVVTAIAPVTNCDPANPNGVARVTVDGAFVGFEFNWYEGSAVAGIPVYTGSEFGELKVAPQAYLVEAKNLDTGCTGNVQTNIASGTVPIPSPQIVKLSDVTSCLFNNGALSASVGGITKDYIFDWYDGTTETPPADFVGEIYDSLAVGFYSVTATSRITGCKSPLVNKDITDKKEFPEFKFQIQNASCDQPNGFATIFFTSTVGISNIEWLSGNQIVAVGPNLTDALSGIYSVRMISELGCEATKDLEILADIRPRNGISRNGDSQNDYFHIDCIDQFENNNVKIFNRAGTLVYEADGYDNANTFFDGVSNKGVSIIGTNVPDGTYFFIVDKRDGSKPIAGYLEIVK